MGPSPLCQISVTASAPHNQIGPLWCWFPNGWACARPRPLWVFPRNSPVRLGVSPAASPTPMGVFTQRFEALFPRSGTLGCEVCLTPQSFLLAYLHSNVGLPSLQATTSASQYLARSTSCCLALSAHPPAPGPPAAALL